MEPDISVSSGTVWERQVGYSRAVRKGRHVEIAGTTAVDQSGEIVGVGDMYAQARFILSKIEDALQQVGASSRDIVRTRMYLTDMSLWPEAGRAHGEVFGDIRPVATAVGVSQLIDPKMLIEIEASAIVSN